MNILLAADIFGNCPTFQRIITELSNTASVVSVTPYQNQVKQFASEDEAYDAFLSVGGMDEYIERIHVISKQQQFDVLIGFSAGGAAIWAAQTYFRHVQHAIAFYPGQLRHYCPNFLLKCRLAAILCVTGQINFFLVAKLQKSRGAELFIKLVRGCHRQHYVPHPRFVWTGYAHLHFLVPLHQRNTAE